MSTLNAAKRREEIINCLKQQQNPVSAATLAARFEVSRQVIVGDIALLRASGCQISSTPKGYLCHRDVSAEVPFAYIGILACCHTLDQTAEELFTIVDFGGVCIDVSIEHSIYGQLTAPLDIHSRYDVELFLQKVQQEAKPLSHLTGGIHVHRVGCTDQQMFLRIKNALQKKGILLPQD